MSWVRSQTMLTWSISSSPAAFPRCFILRLHRFSSWTTWLKSWILRMVYLKCVKPRVDHPYEPFLFYKQFYYHWITTCSTCQWPALEMKNIKLNSGLVVDNQIQPVLHQLFWISQLLAWHFPLSAWAPATLLCSDWPLSHATWRCGLTTNDLVRATMTTSSFFSKTKPRCTKGHIVSFSSVTHC